MDAVLIRASRGQPVKRLAVKRESGCVHAVNPEYIQQFNDGVISPIGFPSEDVFRFDEVRFRALELTWSQLGETKPQDWVGLTRYIT